MRSLVALALVLTACSGGDRSKQSPARTASSTRPTRGPEALLLRVPRDGGIARATAYPNIDSVVWTGTERVPPLDRVLAFDAEGGSMAAVDERGEPLWIDLRVGTVPVATRKPVRGLVSVDGATIYGVGTDGVVARFTPSGNWTFTPPIPARGVFPQPNGSLIFFGGRGANGRIWRMRPTATTLLDSLELPDVSGAAGAPLGDRIYFTLGTRALVGVQARTFEKSPAITFDHRIVDVAATPSGDRYYVISDSSQRVEIIARFEDRVAGGIQLPGIPRALRVDPFGRYILVRPAKGDSVWVVSVGEDRVVGTLHSAWRGDVPFVAPDGAVAIDDGQDLVFVDPGTLKIRNRVADGASDFWYPFVWIGFRPARPALGARSDTAAESDSALGIVPETSETTSDSAGATPADSTKAGFTVSFSVLLDQARAQAAAAKITVEGRGARVVTSMIGGSTVYRVVLGPFPTREEADRIGRASHQPYFVYAGAP